MNTLANTPATRQLFEKLLLRKTSGQPVTDWNNRISLIAEQCGILLFQVNWNQSPQLVAHEVVNKILMGCGDSNKLQELLDGKS